MAFKSKKYEHLLVCPYHPDEELIAGYTAGDMVCPECGLVVGDRVVDLGSEWRTFSDEAIDHSEPSRVGTAENPLMSGSGLRTWIETGRAKFPKGSTASAAGRNQRSAMSRGDAALAKATTEIGQMADKLNLANVIVTRAVALYKRIYEAHGLRGRNNKTVFPTCIYTACRQEGVPRSFKEICAIATVSVREIGRCYQWMTKQLETKLELVTTADFVSRFCGNLGLPRSVEIAANYIAHRAGQLDLVPGRSPVSVTAAAIYMASQVSEDFKTLREVSDVSGAATTAIRNSYQLLYPRARELFQENFKFCTPIESLPVHW